MPPKKFKIIFLRIISVIWFILCVTKGKSEVNTMKKLVLIPAYMPDEKMIEVARDLYI